MMNNWLYLIYAAFLIVSFLVYFKIARKYEIVDLPNHRTMHEGTTIRGGGISVFIFIVIISFFFNEPGYYFFLGLVIVGITGFLDDVIDLSGKIRFPLQVIGIVLILADLDLLSVHLAVILGILILATGTLNAFNFMDGINGMTGGYSLVTLASLTYVNNFVFTFIDNSFLYFVLISLLVFNYYNFRNSAICFAGDVGSLTVAFIIIYLIIKLVSESHEFIYILFLTLYGIDTIFTIIQRIILKQNIFEAHRLHFFQVVVSKTGISHVFMSMIYMFVQVLVNIGILMVANMLVVQQVVYSGAMLIILSIVYIAIKRKMMPQLA